MEYIGRFAPSPTGPLHMGSLVAAVASFLQARSNNGQWLLRIEDLDPPREIAGASIDIMNTLEACGFEWDQEVIFQSQRTVDYEQVLQQLKHARLSYPCACSRSDISQAGQYTPMGLRYPGTCRNGLPENKTARSIRIKTDSSGITFTDLIQGTIDQNLNRDVGDFVIKRADGQIAYQLAVVVDDAMQKVTQVVRGCDLLDSTSRQIYLQHLLGYTTPEYAHIPVLVNKFGDKLSKQNLAKPINKQHLPESLYQALSYLNQNPPASLRKHKLNDIWDWAKMNWQLQMVVKQTSIPETGNTDANN